MVTSRLLNDSGDTCGRRRGGASASVAGIPVVSADATAVGVGVDAGSYSAQGDALLLWPIRRVGTLKVAAVVNPPTDLAAVMDLLPLLSLLHHLVMDQLCQGK